MGRDFSEPSTVIPAKLIMKLPIWIPLLITTYFYVELETLDLSHAELESLKIPCDGSGSCKVPNQSTEVLWQERNCFCDQLCAKYGDCCHDSEYFRDAQQRRSAASFECVNLKRSESGVYMMTTCPPRWRSMSLIEKCENMNVSDPLSTIPVTSHRTNITYRNSYCALCHNDLDITTADFWQPRVECPTLPALVISNETKKNLTDSLTWSGERQEWGIPAANMTWHSCSVGSEVPFTSAEAIRRCREGTIQTCAVNWTNADVRNRCEAYTFLVYGGATATYRNPHCAICNNVALQGLACYKTGLRGYNTKQLHQPFSILFDLRGTPGGAVGKVKPCADHELYDPFFKRCRNVLCPKQDQKFVDGECVVQDDSESGRNEKNEYINDTRLWNKSQEFRSCPKFLLLPDDYEFANFDNTSVYIPVYDKYFREENFQINEDHSLELCAGSLGTRLVNKFGQYMGYVTAIGLGVSIIFLILHLIAFFMVPDLQNLSGKNLASLCVALLIADISFISGQGITLGTNYCIASGVITHYGFLASFFWMMTMAFDIWRTLKMATFELRVSSGKQWKKFTFYSLWSWLAPAAITVAAIVTDFSPVESVNIYIRPLFGVHSCWFGHRYSLLLFFAAPLAVIMVLNIVFFSSSAHMIFSTTSTTRYTASGSTQRDFRLYIRLALVMGLTWITGLLGGFLDVEALWYSFIALNTLQGLFIFLAFTCNDKVIKGVREVLCSRWDYEQDPGDSKERRPPSFSWSGGSSDTTNKSNLGSSSDEGSKHRNYETNSKLNYEVSPQNKNFEDRLVNEYDTGPRSIRKFELSFDTLNSSKDKVFDINSKLAYDPNFREKAYEIFPQINYNSHPHINYGTSPKINPIYGSTNKVSKNTSYDRRHLEDTLY